MAAASAASTSRDANIAQVNDTTDEDVQAFKPISKLEVRS